MRNRVLGGTLHVALYLLLSSACALHAQMPDHGPSKSATEMRDELRFVVIVSRHGVRSPTGKLDQLDQYSQSPWPAWSVPPGCLTEHGAQLMTLFGAYYREQLASGGLLAASGFTDAAKIRIIADSDQRTRETGEGDCQRTRAGL